MTRTPATGGEATGPGAGVHADTPVLLGVSFEEDGMYYGVCLNRFMMTITETFEELEGAIVAMIDDHIEASQELGVPPFAHLPNAPREYWTLWLRLTADGAPLKTLQPPPGRERPPLQIAQELRAA